MDPLKPLRELWQSRLWPVAVLLLVALAAVPMLLSREPDPVAAPSVAPAASAADDTASVVGVTDPGARDAARRVLGSEKNPFRAAQTPTPEPREDEGGGGSEPGSGAGTGGSAPGSGDTGSGSTGGGSSPTPAPAPSATPVPAPDADPAPPQSFPLNSLRVRFGTTENPDHAERTLSRLSGLPKGATPALLYLGLLDDRKTAVFLVREGVSTVGDGTCRPSPDTCERLLMRKGDIQFVGVGGGDAAGEYQVEILRVNSRRTTSVSAARRSRSHTFPGGRRWLRSLDEQAGELRYDPATGVLGRD